MFGLDSLYLVGADWVGSSLWGLFLYPEGWCCHEDIGFVCVSLLELGIVVLMASAQVLPNSMASTRKLEHLEAGKRRVWIFLFLLFSLSSLLLSQIQIFSLGSVELLCFLGMCLCAFLFESVGKLTWGFCMHWAG